MPRHFRLRHGDQFRIHECKIVRNVKTDYPRVLEHVAISALYFCPVRLFHNNDQIRPSDGLGRKRRFSVVVRARRGDFDIISSGKYLLCCGASPTGIRHDWLCRYRRRDLARHFPELSGCPEAELNRRPPTLGQVLYPVQTQPHRGVPTGAPDT